MRHAPRTETAGAAPIRDSAGRPGAATLTDHSPRGQRLQALAHLAVQGSAVVAQARGLARMFGAEAKVYRPRGLSWAERVAAGPPAQLNQVYVAGQEGAAGVLQAPADGVDYDTADWLQFIADQELVYVSPGDRAAFEIQFPDAMFVPAEVAEPADYAAEDPAVDEPDVHPHELEINADGDPDRAARITAVVLRGSYTAEQHQELMCVLAGGNGDLCLRFSRNQVSDTIQWNARLSFGNTPELERHAVDITVGAACDAFAAAHNAMRAYDQGDCQAFAAHIRGTLGV